MAQGVAGRSDEAHPGRLGGGHQKGEGTIDDSALTAVCFSCDKGSVLLLRDARRIA